MKLKILSNSGRVKAGTVLEVDAIRFDPEYVGAFSVRVSNVWKRPRWFAIGWFVEIPKGVDWALRAAAKSIVGKE